MKFYAATLAVAASLAACLPYAKADEGAQEVVQVKIDAKTQGEPISPFIYGQFI